MSVEYFTCKSSQGFEKKTCKTMHRLVRTLNKLVSSYKLTRLLFTYAFDEISDQEVAFSNVIIKYHEKNKEKNLRKKLILAFV